ncbi:LamG domain-containing protein [Candidatus Poribacteria bacterium]
MIKFLSSLVFLILAVGFVAHVSSAADLLDGLVGYWPMNGNAKDRAGSNHGTFEGGVSTAVDAQRGSVLKVDGTDDYVSIPDSADFDIVGDFTVAFWMKPSSNFDSSSPASMPPLGKYGSGDFQMIFTLIGSDYTVGIEGMDNLLAGGMDMKIEDKSDGNSFLYVGSLIDSWEADTWYHVTGVYVDVDATAHLYINGEFQNSSTTWDSTAAVLEKVGGNLEIGRTTLEQAGGAVKYFEGSLDDVALYGLLWTQMKSRSWRILLPS